ncbi:MAG: choice-of-anchor B family protein, partial [Gemmatimonadales bacterium]
MKIVRVSLLGAALTVVPIAPAWGQTHASDRLPQPSMTGFGQAVAVAGDQILVGEPLNTYQTGFVFVFERNRDGEWSEIAAVSASDASWGDRFGRTIAVDGNTMAVSAPGVDVGGVVYVFERSGGDWNEVARLTADDVSPGDGFGNEWSVALSGDNLLVGADIQANQTGAVYAFKRDGRTWTANGKLIGSEVAEGHRFGNAIGLAGRNALIAARGHNSNRGAIYSFRLNDDGEWEERGLVSPDFLEEGDQMAFSIVVEGNRAAVGTLFTDNQVGTVFLVDYDEARAEWIPSDMLEPFDAAGQPRFGRSVALSGNQVLVGAPGANGFTGVLYIHTADAEGRWVGAAKLSAENLQGGDYSSAYLSVDGDLGVMGKRGSGAAYVIERTGTTWAITATLTSDTYDGLQPITGEMVACADGTASVFDCGDVDLVSFLSVQSIGGPPGVQVNDVWGWEDPQTGREYALVGRQDAAAFVDITDPSNPQYLGELPRTDGSPVSVWRDIKVYENHAFIVADGAGQHGMQVFDLTQLRNVGSSAPMTFTAAARYDGIGSAHNIVINEATGYAYAVGVNSGGETCGGGLHIINIQNPTDPTFVGCFSDPETGRVGTGYSHDAQCIVYNGPDADYQGHEICFGSNETALSIADVTDKQNPVAVSNATYPSVGYAHQGWVTDDHRYFFMDDELDELSHEEINRTRTLIWDISDLDDPIL